MRFKRQTLAVLINMICVGGVYAQAEVVTASLVQKKIYQIPAGDLVKVLSQFSTQAGVVFSFNASVLKNMQSSGLTGSYSVEQGFEKILTNTGYTAVKRGDIYVLLQSSTTQSSDISPTPTHLSSKDKNILRLSTITLYATESDPADDVYKKASSSTYLSAEQLNRFGRISPADILKGVAGVQTGDTRNGGALDVNIRGIQGMGRVQVTVDGSQQSMETYRGYGGTQNRSYISADLISNITIDKGPSQHAGASGAIGGTVAMQTLGVQDILKTDQDTGFRITGNLWTNSVDPQLNAPRGSFMQVPARQAPAEMSQFKGRSGSIAFAKTTALVDVVAAYAIQHQGNYFAGKHGSQRYEETNKKTVTDMFRPGEEVMNSSNQSESFLFKTVIRPSDHQSLELGYRHYDGEFGEIMGSALIRGEGISQWPVGSMKINSYTTKYQFKPDNPLINLTVNAWLTDAKSHQLNAGPTAPDSQISVLGSNYRWAKLRNTRWGFDFNNIMTFSPSIGEFAWTVGGSYLEEDVKPDDVLITQNDYNNNKVLRDAKRKEGSLLTQLSYKPIDALEFQVGGRYTKYENTDRNRFSQLEHVFDQKPFKTIRVSGRLPNGFIGQLGSTKWYPDQNGIYQESDNPVNIYKNGQDPNFKIENYKGEQFTVQEFEELYGKIENISYMRNDQSEQKGTYLGTQYQLSEPVKTEGEAFAPFVGVSYKINPYSQIYVNYREAIRVPGLFETTMGMQSGLTYANPDLKPERTQNWEIGLSAFKDGLLTDHDAARIKVSYFDNHIKNFITRYLLTQTQGPLPQTLEMYNAESFSVTGVELQSSYDMGRFFSDLAVTKYFKAETCDAKAAQILAKNKYRGNPTACVSGGFEGSYVNTQNPPEYTIGLTMGTRWLDDKLTIGARLTKNSGPISKLDRAWQGQTTTPQIYYHPTEIIDAFVNYDYNQAMNINFSVDNITNRYYLDPLAQSLMPAPGRNYRLALQYKF